MKTKQRQELLAICGARFERFVQRHAGIDWGDVLERLEAQPQRLESLWQMEATGGEPDVIGRDKRTGEFLIVDCSAESPTGRRSGCYDGDARESRKENRPASSALELAASIGIEILTEEQYRELQRLGSFDTKTSSWIKTPDTIRRLGGALFCDRRYDTVFVYHNGASSYYAARGFRGLLRV